MIRQALASFLALAFVAAALPAAAQSIPAGTYQQSCTDIQRHGMRITANCSAPGGQRITSSTSAICNGDIGNVSGYLRCNGGSATGAIPAGTYQQSCTDIHRRGLQVTATCSAPGGQRITSSTSTVCNGDIGNVGGYLRCNGQPAAVLPGRPVAGGFPAGSWRAYCTQPEMQGSIFVANCRTDMSGVTRARIDMNTCPRRVVGARNGILYCDRH